MLTFEVGMSNKAYMREIRTPGIIHIFAFLHAAVALSCRAAGVGDELLLTILTMSMALIICLKKGLTIEFTAASIIVAYIIGYVLGNIGANLLVMFFSSSYIVHALSTLLTTEILGWSLVGVITVFRQGRDGGDQQMETRYVNWLLLAMAGAFFLRLGIIIFTHASLVTGSIMEASSRMFSNSVVVIVLICINILYVRFSDKLQGGKSMIVRVLILCSFILLTSFLSALAVHLGLPFSFSWNAGDGLGVLYLAALLIEMTVYCLVYMINYALKARSEMQEAKGKAYRERYRYVKLKQQVNPHFLFNSLNILDCLVCEEKTEQASLYIHKLAGIYRYMIKSEEEQLVSLRDELAFVGLYVDLLQVRFPEGFEVKVEVDEALMSRYVLPCSLQLLIENATKHNSVSVDKPLVVNIKASGNSVTVGNNIIPKMTKSPSTGLGLKYIRQHYVDLSGRNIRIDRTEEEYRVTLPLI